MIHKNIRTLALEDLESRRLLAVYLVTNTEDAGVGSLRDAILASNANSGPDEIRFGIQSHSKTIKLLSPLPDILDPVSIDATTQPGFGQAPLVELSGGDLQTDFGNGFFIATSNTTIQGFVINQFPGSGIRIEGGNSHTISGNYIGTDLTGNQALPNGFSGVLIINSSSNLVGGLSGYSGNVLSGNTVNGVRIEGFDATGNLVQGNLIGTDSTGSTSIPNGEEGVLIQNDATQNTVGTNGDGLNDAEEANVVSGNAEAGLRIFRAHENIVSGNRIGLNADANGALPNSSYGIVIDNASRGNLIGSDGNQISDDLERNIVSGNVSAGIGIFGAGTSMNIVSGNFIGTDASGEIAIANDLGIGLFQFSSSNTIGSYNGQFLGNLISGNDGDGVWIDDSSGNRVGGNFVGVNVHGSQAVANQGRGVRIMGSSSQNLIGTDDNAQADETERNLLSGNLHQGVAVGGASAQGNVIAGNYIGSDVSGLQAIANTSTGILLGDNSNLNVVGTTEDSRSDSAAGNLISGNQVFGVRFRNGAHHNQLAGNTIGLDATGESGLPNGASGVGSFQAAQRNTIGGTSPQTRNVISGNLGWGIYIQPESGDNEIDGNWIGQDLSGSALGNAAGGILIEDASNNRIGSRLGNTIAHNGPTGIAIIGSEANQNSIERNEIFGHTELGIDLAHNGRTTNDPLDTDLGPNSLQNFPEIQYVQRAGSTFISGVLHSLADAIFQIDLYIADSADSGEGQVYLASVQATTDAQGVANWSAITAAIGLGQAITATATELGRGTHSEFAKPLVGLPPIDFLLASGRVSEDIGSFEVTLTREDLPLDDELVVEFGAYSIHQILLPDQVVLPAGEFSIPFTVQVIDDAIVEEELSIEVIAIVPGRATDKLRFTIEDNDIPQWHNTFQPADVNGDRFVSPIDALLVINYLNSQSESNLAGREPFNPSVFIDVNDDSFATPIDALLVVNLLNQRNGEGESARDTATEIVSEFSASLQAGPDWELEIERLAKWRRGIFADYE